MSQLESFFTRNMYAPLGVHIFVVIFYLITGALLNAIVVHLMKVKPKKQELDIYILALALTDIGQTTIVCPQFPFLPQYIDALKDNNSFPLRQVLTFGTFFNMMYFGILTAVAVTRFFAVFRPYDFGRSVERAKWVIALIFLVSVVFAMVMVNGRLLFQYDETNIAMTMSLPLVLCFIALLVSYPAIILKLVYHRRKMAFRKSGDIKTNHLHGPSASMKKKDTSENKSKDNPKPVKGTQTSGGTDEIVHVSSIEIIVSPTPIQNMKATSHKVLETGSQKKEDGKNKPTSRDATALHMKTMKMFAVITVIFLVSCIPIVIVDRHVTKYFYVGYAGFLNHSFNFVVYLYFNADFRKDAFYLWVKLSSCCSGAPQVS